MIGTLRTGTGARTAMVALGAGLLTSGLALAVEPNAAAPRTIEFNRDVRPILSENCFACHGPDARKRKANLRLDVEESAKSALKSGAQAIVPGKPDESELIERLRTDDKNAVMPPPETGKSLTPEQVATLKAWIDSGATWEPHWSLAPIKRPTPPAIAEPGFSRNPIDAFLLTRIREAALKPSPEADRTTLIRRLGFDLIGLPPSTEDVDRFVNDPDPDAYERLVDRLLASPRFGERMAMFWLDLVRYADSVGYHGDQPISVSPFRDYVIKSFNDNKRFDRFTVEQLAGDMLPNPTREQNVGAGYNRLGMMSAEGGVQPKEYLAKYAAERVRNVSGAWLGITLGCAECHDHKFDPLTTKDFYRFEAFFADIQERGLYDGANFGPSIPVPNDEQAAAIAKLDAEIAAVRGELQKPRPELAAAQAAWEQSAAGTTGWITLPVTKAESTGGATMTTQPDGSILVSGKSPATDSYKITTKLPVALATAIRIEALPDDSLPGKGPGRAPNGNFVLSELGVAVRRTPTAKPQPLVLDNATASFEQTEFSNGNPDKRFTPSGALDGETRGPTTGWAILPEMGRTNEAVFETVIDVAGGPEATLEFTLAQNLPNPKHTLGRFRLSAASAVRPAKALGVGLPREIRDALSVPVDKRDQKLKDVLAAHYRTIAPELAPLREKLAGLEKSRNELNVRVPTMLATLRVEPRMIRVLPRGNWMDDSGEVVSPGVPAALPQPDAQAENARLTRLELAHWIVSPENPLTARALANRLWKIYFGAGLSRKLDDLGSQGEWPSHPELLDWLAGRLIDSGWDVKATIKTIVMSGAYRQTSATTAEMKEKDPFNRLLARQSRFRLDAEMVRDTALEISGLLVDEMGGPSVRPYQPPGYWSFLNFPTREWENSRGPELYRRGLYTHWQRQYLHPSLLAFDAPSREECTAERGRSNTPLQALVLLNDPSYVEAAKVFAERIVREGGSSPDERLDWAMKHALSRQTKPAEKPVLLALLNKHLAEYKADPASATAVLTVGERPAPKDLDPAELAAWTSVARTLLNTHAAITRN